MKKLSLIALSTAAGLCGLSQITACGGPSDEPSVDATWAALRACDLDDGTVDHGALIRACDPQDTKKTTICHIPPGNPANAHTLCIGNPAVAAHLRLHGDHLGPCQTETPCPPPPTGGGCGSETPAGSCGSGGATVGTGGAPGNGGTGGVTIQIIP